MFAILKNVIRKIFAVLTIIIGSALLVWNIYNTFIEMKPAYEPYSKLWFLGIIQSLVFIAVGFYWLNTKSGKIDEEDIDEEEEDEDYY